MLMAEREIEPANQRDRSVSQVYSIFTHTPTDRRKLAGSAVWLTAENVLRNNLIVIVLLFISLLSVFSRSRLF